jgi:hypothetical protein
VILIEKFGCVLTAVRPDKQTIKQTSMLSEAALKLPEH